MWWILGQLYDKDLLYKGYSVQPYSPAAGTGLSTHELNMPGLLQNGQRRISNSSIQVDKR